MQDEIAALREERERTRKERELRNKRRRLLLGSKLDPDVSSSTQLDGASTKFGDTQTSIGDMVVGSLEVNSNGGGGKKIPVDSNNRKAPSSNDERGSKEAKKRDRDHKTSSRDNHTTTLEKRTEHTKHQTNSASTRSGRLEEKLEPRKGKGSSSSTNTTSTPNFIPKNDYSQHFVDTKQRPQNFIRDADLSDRFEEYVFQLITISS